MSELVLEKDGKVDVWTAENGEARRKSRENEQTDY